MHASHTLDMNDGCSCLPPTGVTCQCGWGHIQSNPLENHGFTQSPMYQETCTCSVFVNLSNTTATPGGHSKVMNGLLYYGFSQQGSLVCKQSHTHFEPHPPPTSALTWYVSP